MILRRKSDGFSEVLPAWRGEVGVILGSGPSLTREQCDYVRGRARVIAINNAYLLAPWADVLYFGDEKWLRGYKNEQRQEFQNFRGERCTIEEAGKQPGDARFHILRNKDHLSGRIQAEGLSDDPDAIVSGRHSGYAAINVLWLAGVTRIVLLGYDFRTINGKDHFVGGEHPAPTTDADLAAALAHYRTLENPAKDRGIEIVNATPGSRLERFPRVPLDLVTWFRESVAA